MFSLLIKHSKCADSQFQSFPYANLIGRWREIMHRKIKTKNFLFLGGVFRKKVFIVMLQRQNDKIRVGEVFFLEQFAD